MKVSLFITFLFITASASPTTLSASLDDLDWLSGCWVASLGSTTIAEMWMPPQAGLMLGVSRTTREESVRTFEYMRIRQEGDTIVYTASPAGQTTTDFTATIATTTHLRVENRMHDSPQAIEYILTDPQTIAIRVYNDANSTTPAFQYQYTKASCEAA